MGVLSEFGELLEDSPLSIRVVKNFMMINLLVLLERVRRSSLAGGQIFSSISSRTRDRGCVNTRWSVNWSCQKIKFTKKEKP